MKWTAGRAVIEDVVCRADDEDVLLVVERASKTGIDCPFGWPAAIADTSCVDFPGDPGLVAVALRFGVAPNALLGHGGEAWVYAIDDDRVLRILHDGGRKADVLRRMALVEELALSQPVYRLPEVLDRGVSRHLRVARRPSSSCSCRIRRPHRRRPDRRSCLAHVPRGACGQESREVDARAPASRPCRHCRRTPRRIHHLVRPLGRVRRQLSH